MVSKKFGQFKIVLFSKSFRICPALIFSLYPQFLLLPTRFGLGLLKIQVRLVIGMLGALFFGKQTFNHQQLQARIV